MNKKTLVLGASLRPHRYSNFAIQQLLANQVEVVAIGNSSGEVAGVIIETKPIKFKDIHTITLYLNAKSQLEYYDYILSLNPSRVIFNPGTENPELYQLLNANNIYFESACTLVLLSTNQY